MNRLAVVVSFSFLFGSVAVGQSSAPPDHRTGVTYSRTMSFGEMGGMKAATGAPYSAEEVIEVDQTLADGTQIKMERTTSKKFRDSTGRTRIERPLGGPMGMGAENAAAPVLVHIFDPVAHVRYILDPEKKIAYRHELAGSGDDAAPSGFGAGPGVLEGRALVTTEGDEVDNTKITMPPVRVPRGGAPTVHVRADDASRPKTTRENLGSETIEGVPVEGTRLTTTWPVGSLGNDRPLVVIHEFWRSPELKMSILSKSDDPRTGQRTHKLINIGRSEPDAALFQPPPDYTVKDEGGKFTIGWSSPR